MSPRRGGFTLIELMVVVTIIGVLISLMFPIYSTAMRSVQEANCQGNIAQLAKVMQAYCLANNGYFPYVGFKDTSGNFAINPSASDWLYTSTVANSRDLTSRVAVITTVAGSRAGDMQEGAFVKNKLIGKLESFYCPTDWDLGLVRGPASASLNPNGTRNFSSYLNYTIYGTIEVRPATSYVVNSAITFGETTPRRVRKISDFGPSTFLFIEESSSDTEHGEKTSACNRAFMHCDDTTRALTSRHRGGGYIACMDGHVEWMPPDAPSDNPLDPNAFEASRTFALNRANAQNKAWYNTTGSRWGP
jgi:prepilin-type N-terminal cleavage/methylation domain-containing protein